MLIPRHSLASMAIVFAAGCTLRPHLVAAQVDQSAGMANVAVTIRSTDARDIRRREMYFSIVVHECADPKNRFPIIRPYIDGRPVSEFDFPVDEQDTIVHGEMPMRMLDAIPNPCVALQGGSYLFGKLQSDVIPIKRLEAK